MTRHEGLCFEWTVKSSRPHNLQILFYLTIASSTPQNRRHVFVCRYIVVLSEVEMRINFQEVRRSKGEQEKSS